MGDPRRHDDHWTNVVRLPHPWQSPTGAVTATPAQLAHALKALDLDAADAKSLRSSPPRSMVEEPAALEVSCRLAARSDATADAVAKRPCQTKRFS